MKKLFVLLIAIVASIGTMFAGGTNVGGVYYTFSSYNNTATVTYRGNNYDSYNEYSGTVTIPETVTYYNTTYTVTTIGANAFRGSSVSTVNLPKTIKYINSYAFYWCSKLKSITIPENVTSISKDAFYNLNTVVWNAKNYPSYDNASLNTSPLFGTASTVTSIIFGDSVEYIPSYLCAGMSNLTSVKISNSVKDVGPNVFYGCTGMTDAIYSDSIFVCLLPYSFSGKYVIPDGIRTICPGAFTYNPGLTAVTIPNSVTAIGNGAFADCTELTSITIPESVTNMGYSVFSGCTGLPVIDNIRYAGSSYIVEATDKTLSSYPIASGTKWIGYGAFKGCSNMESLILPEGLLRIDQEAFYECKKIETLTIPKSLTSIGIYAFSGCTNLSSVQWNAKSCSFEPLSWTYGYAGKTPFARTNITSFVFSAEVEDIPDNLCAETNIASVVIPKSVKYIGKNVFSACQNLTSVVWNAINCKNQYDNINYDNYDEYGYGVDEGSSYAPFYGSSQISSFVFGEEVKYIPPYLCIDMSEVPSFTIPCSVDSIGNSALNIKKVILRNCGKTSQVFDTITLCVETDVENVPKWVKDTLSQKDPMPTWEGYGGTYVQYSYNNTYDSVIKTMTIIAGHVDSIQLPDTIICRKGAEICDAYNNCQAFYESGIFTQTYKNIYGCDSVVTQNVILRQDTIFLPDTTVCYGELVSFNNNKTYSYAYMDDFESSKWDGYWNKEAAMNYFQTHPYATYHELYFPSFDAESYLADHASEYDSKYEEEYEGGLYEYVWILFEDWYRGHFHTIKDASECPDGMNCSETVVDGQRFYSDGVLTRNYISAGGCDSIVTRKVFVNQTVLPKLNPKPEQDNVNTGGLQLFDVYCSDEQYVGYDGGADCGPYKHIYTKARYAYFTIDGVKYNRANKTNDIPSYNDTWSYTRYCSDGILMNPDYTINNLASGDHRVVFYTDCDSIVQNVNVPGFGIKVNGIYYIFNREAQTATVTYRGESHDMYENEYSGALVIPDSVIFKETTYKVTMIDQDAFYHCDNVTSITIESKEPIRVGYYSYDTKRLNISSKIPVYVPYGALTAYRSSYCYELLNLHVLNPKHVSSTQGATSASITLGDAEDAKHIVSCGVEGGDTEFAGNVVEYIGLEPNSAHNDIAFFINTKEGDRDTLHYSFKTAELTLTTKESKAVSSTTAILLAETNISDAETNCGFEYKRNDAPDDFTPTKVYCPVASGQMAGRLKNLRDDVYYKYRAFYESTSGKKYYGEWKYIFTGDIAVEFDPILYTYGATVVGEREATINGYALAGSEDFTEQGFEYWAETRVPRSGNAPLRMPAAYQEEIGKHHFVQAKGITMRVTLTNLDPGTVYKYRVYATVGNDTITGSEMSFSTEGIYYEPSYVITFVNWDGEVLQSAPVETGTMPVYNGAEPVRPEDDDYTYVFSGWSPELVIVTEAATYTAQFIPHEATAIDNVQSDDVQCTKVLRNGQIYIMYKGTMYNVLGGKVK